MPSTYYNPVRTVLGAGVLDTLPEVVAGRRTLLVTFPEAAGLGLVARIERLLADRLVGVVDDVQPNPDVAELRDTYDRVWAAPQPPEVIVAVGGGSTIDTAKALLVATADRRFDALLAALEDPRGFVPAHARTLVAVPTTAGTGSEVTPWATVWNRAAGRKHSLHLPQTWPHTALVDPALMLSLPAAPTLASGLDALSHALEAIWNVNANPVSDTLAVAAVHAVLDTLPALMRQREDLGLRTRMAEAALQAGLAFSNTRTALAHSISYEMTLRHGLPHGIACAFTLPMVLERARGRRADRDRVLERALGELHGAPARLADFLERLGVPTRFEAYGVAADAADIMVQHALTGARGRNFIGA